MTECIFCKIIKGEIPKQFDFESENIVVFPDINPAADIHLLIVPKKHIKGIEEIGAAQADLLIEVYATVNQLVKESKLQNDSYRVVINGGRAQHVPHLHFHLLGGQWKKML